MNIMYKYAIYSIEILKDYLPIRPKVQLTQAKTYYGNCYTESLNDKIDKAVIRLSRWNHIDQLWLMDHEDHIEIIDTICHELAHLLCFEHCKEHTELTAAFKDHVILYFEEMEFLDKKTA